MVDYTAVSESMHRQFDDNGNEISCPCFRMFGFYAISAAVSRGELKMRRSAFRDISLFFVVVLSNVVSGILRSIEGVASDMEQEFAVFPKIDPIG